MSFRFTLSPVPKLPPELASLEVWLQDARTRIMAWFNKERALGSYLTYDSQDQKTINLTTLATALAPVINSLLSHSSLSNLSADDHGQYIHTAPTVNERNEIHPAATVVALSLFCETNDADNILNMWDSTGAAIQAHFDNKGTYTDDP